uniref:LHFPL tetraspan subfamily member 3 n=1 Tax=Esox lucius TaxID=8010 RepID=A0AAY5KIJ0_ESOLU
MIPGSAASMLAPMSLEDIKLYQHNYVRNSRAIGLLWAIFTILFAILNVVIFSQPYWIGDGADTPQAGYFGLFHFCTGDGIQRELDCTGTFTEFANIPSTAFKAASFFVGMSMMLVMACIASFTLFFLFSTTTVYKICGWMQGASGLLLSPVSWTATQPILFGVSWGFGPGAGASNTWLTGTATGRRSAPGCRLGTSSTRASSLTSIVGVPVSRVCARVGRQVASVGGGGSVTP